MRSSKYAVFSTLAPGMQNELKELMYKSLLVEVIHRINRNSAVKCRSL